MKRAALLLLLSIGTRETIKNITKSVKRNFPWIFLYLGTYHSISLFLSLLRYSFSLSLFFSICFIMLLILLSIYLSLCLSLSFSFITLLILLSLCFSLSLYFYLCFFVSISFLILSHTLTKNTKRSTAITYFFVITQASCTKIKIWNNERTRRRKIKGTLNDAGIGHR